MKHQNSDPLGQAMTDFLQQGRADTLQLTSSVGEPDLFPVSHLFRTEEDCPAIERLAMDQCCGTVLDVGAGAGAHSLILQQRGFEVTALEQSALAVDVMKVRGVRQVVQADFFSYRESRYDTLLMLMNGVGIVGRLSKLPSFLSHAKNLLKPGGQLLLDSSDLIDYYADDTGAINLMTSTKEYYGEVHYQLQYRDSSTASFDWLFVDPDTLNEYVVAGGGKLELLQESDDGAYLARICF